MTLTLNGSAFTFFHACTQDIYWGRGRGRDGVRGRNGAPWLLPLKFWIFYQLQCCGTPQHAATCNQNGGGLQVPACHLRRAGWDLGCPWMPGRGVFNIGGFQSEQGTADALERVMKIVPVCELEVVGLPRFDKMSGRAAGLHPPSRPQV